MDNIVVFIYVHIFKQIPDVCFLQSDLNLSIYNGTEIIYIIHRNYEN